MQTVEESGRTSSTAAFLSGKLHFPSGKVASYKFEMKAASSKQISFLLSISPINGQEATRVYFVYSSSLEERIFGTGFQYSFFDLKGGCVPIFTQEQGIGRGRNPSKSFPSPLNTVSRSTTSFIHYQPGSKRCSRDLADILRSLGTLSHQQTAIHVPGIN